MDSKSIPKSLQYWEKLNRRICSQEKKKAAKMSQKQKQFECINRKMIAIHYLFTVLQCHIPVKIYRPFREICVAIGKKKGSLIKQDSDTSRLYKASFAAVEQRDAKLLNHKISVVIKYIKKNPRLMKKIKRRCILAHIALSLEYNQWVRPFSNLFQALGIIKNAKKATEKIFMIKKEGVLAHSRRRYLSDNKRKKLMRRRKKKMKKIYRRILKKHSSTQLSV